MSRRPQERKRKPYLTQAAIARAEKAQALAKVNKMKPIYDFLFPPNGEWDWYVSPKGYKFVKIKVRKEQAA